ncbi:MAG TPA: hypothetical protein VMU88_03400 [bacterium]|nr:hypothetical protein [bacterium]
MAFVFRYMAGMLAGLAALGGCLALRHPAKGFGREAPFFAFGLALFFLAFALGGWAWVAGKNKKPSLWKIIGLGLLFFLCLKALVILLLFAGPA